MSDNSDNQDLTNTTSSPIILESESTDRVESSSGDSITELAKKYGWHAEGEKSAEEFIEYALKEVPERGKKLKTYMKTVDDLKVHMRKQQEYALKQAAEELQEKKRLAQDNNYATYQQLDREEAKLSPVNLDIKDAYDDFTARHAEWLNPKDRKTRNMRSWLRQADDDIGKLGLSPKEHFEMLDKEVQEEFPGYFNGSQSEAPQRHQAVESDGYNSVTIPKSKKLQFSSLPKEMQEAAIRLEKSGSMTRQQYLDDLIKFGDI